MQALYVLNLAVDERVSHTFPQSVRKQRLTCSSRHELLLRVPVLRRRCSGSVQLTLIDRCLWLGPNFDHFSSRKAQRGRCFWSSVG